MSRIIYLLGAGASRGFRNTDDPKYKLKKGESNIIEGLPLVNEISDRLEYLIQSFARYDVPSSLRNTIFPIGEIAGIDYDQTVSMLVSDLTWLKNESARHATIDTFAKKLYLKGDMGNFYKVELLLTIFFVLEQLINKPDSRYDTFLASVLTKELELPEDIGILTWNYDSQFEIAYKEYTDNDSNYIHNKLFVYDVKTDKPIEDNQERPKGFIKSDDNIGFHNMNAFANHKIIKLNGTANFKEQLPITDYFDSPSEVFLRELLNRYVLYDKEKDGYGYTRLSFAWDNSEYIDDFFDKKIKEMVGDAETLVVIGYTFPFFNRETDRRIFELMKNLNYVYIQDPKAHEIQKNINPVLSVVKKPYLFNRVTPITNVDQFFLPPEM